MGSCNYRTRCCMHGAGEKHRRRRQRGAATGGEGSDRRDALGSASRPGASFIHNTMGMFPRKEDTGEEGRRSYVSNLLNRMVLV